MTHFYAFAGLYEIWVTVTDEDGNFVYPTVVDTEAPQQTPVYDGPVIVQAIISPSETQGLIPITVQATAGNGGEIILYRWDLDGDGEYEIESPTPDTDAAADSDGWVFVNVAVVDAAGI